ncbi:uncharacterized protein FIBRA_07151 [Fibroporia radiculosa]|uniref:Cytosolic endo-beta-N-acetylglucosaminidase TIM barrel domain-containing protein n=1 Tax=Fibroporia radiculosa TaxID=599839 RepID=J4H4G5_9APHY|nr:uncharacterized protein FIBRA_07151 [Fibroporia radiculosa]CCM04954.1 predicted protein [Fibroporia radiculosa]
MPLRGSGHSNAVLDDAPYFTSLAELDVWASKPSAKLTSVIPYHSRSQDLSADGQGRLLVCHDYKGGYTEAPSKLAYTFNFWSRCDTFIYYSRESSFSHHRVTIPPSGWINAAHRQGVKMLGTLIFEGSGQSDCLRLLVGLLPQAGPGMRSSDTSLPLSPHYARLLATLAYQRGFDGYLLNIECPLIGNVEQTQVLAAWISLLEGELRRQVGTHAQVIWYDSVVVTGDLRWQNRLNNYNLPFFLPSTGFFTNYTWPPHYPSRTAQYFLSLDPALISRPKSLQDIFVGVDVWGRGQHGGGGFGSYRAITHIDPKSLGLSVALFGQAWTWETEQDKPGFTWETWWDYERKLWVGPPDATDTVVVPPEQLQSGRPGCDHGKFAPIVSFFPGRSPPNPTELPFLTWFSPGVGRAWFINGMKILEAHEGWTDLDKTTSLGDMLWPRPPAEWEDGRKEPLPEVIASLLMDDAWLGGSSVNLALSISGSEAEDAFFRCIWVPIQSLSVTPGLLYDMTLTYKATSDRPVDFDLGLSVRLSGEGAGSDRVEITPLALEGPSTQHDWTRMAITFKIPLDSLADVSVSSGLLVGFAMEDPTEAIHIDVHLGLLSVHPTSMPSSRSIHNARILWADFQREPVHTHRFSGTLTWQIAATLSPLNNIPISRDSENIEPLWKPAALFPSFAHFNVYVQPYPVDGRVHSPDEATFIGTTGLDGREHRFYVDPACLPPSLSEARVARFYVQGVTDRGHVLSWDRCAYVDVRV